jgi:hypothetical protein
MTENGVVESKPEKCEKEISETELVSDEDELSNIIENRILEVKGLEQDEVWETLKVNPDFEINVNTHQIRRIADGFIPKIHHNCGYERINLNKKSYYVHVILANQFLFNPDNLKEVDHIDRNKNNNSLSNLRYVSRSTNQKNRSSFCSRKYIYYDSLSENSFEIKSYVKYSFEHYHYDKERKCFVFFNGLKYRRLIENCLKGSYFVNMRDIDNINRIVMINKFKKLNNLI